ncbi:MAG: serine/threonine-protein kinase, partial [Ramlibacter sp.]
MHQRKLGRYELLRVLGKGAMGVVYEARDPNLDRRVAIKTIMVDDLAPGAAAEYEERFRTEARSAARLQHPNIVSVYDSDRDGNTAFLVMEFIEGDDLKRHLDRGDRHDVQQALRLITDLLAALDFAHRQGVVHRDVKPANLLIEPGGRLKLTDFGVARIAGEATRTQGSMIGTLKYMAPEQVQGQKIDSRADLFSAAVVAYQLVTGVRPFDGD